MYEETPGPKLEPLHNKTPDFQLDLHPSGQYVARQVTTRESRQRAAIWDTQTGQIVWRRENANAMCWAANGQMLLAACEYERPSASNEYDPNIVELWTWPNPALIGEAPVDVGAGWVLEIIASPTNNTAFVAAADQSGGGIEWVAWNEKSIWAEPEKGYWGSDDVTLAIVYTMFSPSGAHAVIISANDYWWMDESSDDPAEPSSGGTLRCGTIAVCDCASGAAREIAVFVDVPSGYLPEDPDENGIEFLGRPVFSTNEEFTIRLGNGETRAFSVF